MTSFARSKATYGLNECGAARPVLPGHHVTWHAALAVAAAAAGEGQSESSYGRPPRSMTKTYIKILGTL